MNHWGLNIGKLGLIGVLSASLTSGVPLNTSSDAYGMSSSCFRLDNWSELRRGQLANLSPQTRLCAAVESQATLVSLIAPLLET